MISRTSLHVVKALRHLARLPKGTYAGAGTIAVAIDAPQNYLSKQLQLLARNGMVESRRGSGGGFRLNRDPSEITLYEVVSSIEDVEVWTRCLLGQKDCSDEDPCALHAKWSSVREQYLALLRTTTIAEVAVEDSIQA
jgi:Rrf2 family protein